MKTTTDLLQAIRAIFKERCPFILTENEAYKLYSHWIDIKKSGARATARLSGGVTLTPFNSNLLQLTTGKVDSPDEYLSTLKTAPIASDEQFDEVFNKFLSPDFQFWLKDYKFDHVIFVKEVKMLIDNILHLLRSSEGYVLTHVLIDTTENLKIPVPSFRNRPWLKINHRPSGAAQYEVGNPIGIRMFVANPFGHSDLIEIVIDVLQKTIPEQEIEMWEKLNGVKPTYLADVRIGADGKQTVTPKSFKIIGNH